MACTAVIATTPTISSTEHPRDKSFTGFLIPWHNGPYASAFANLWTNLYPIFPAFKSGKIKTFALPSILLPGAFSLETSGTIAASSWSSPSALISGAILFKISVASTTFWVNSDLALP